MIMLWKKTRHHHHHHRHESNPSDCGVRTGRWFAKIAALLIALFCIPFASILTVFIALPPVYDDTFVGELGEKFDLLQNTEGEKIVVIGGSSVAFGLDSELMSKEMNRQVVNFGLYADLGTKIMMDLSKVNIGQGDIIILAPEMNAQTLSLYFNGPTTLQTLDGNAEMLPYIAAGDYEKLIGASYEFTSNKLNFLLSGKKPDSGNPAYQKDNFNEYGDNVYDRPYNEMTGVTNYITLDFYADFEDDVETEYEEYIDYVNDYVEYVQKRGAIVYFSFCPMNEIALSDENTEESIERFYQNLRDVLKCQVISDVYDYIMDEGYFFDSEFHLNNAGVTARTVQLIKDIKRTLRNNSAVNVEIPEPPGYRPIEGGEISEEDRANAENFLLEAYAFGSATYYKIVGLTEKGKTAETLTIPDFAPDADGNAIPVVQIAPEAFRDCPTLKTLYLGDQISLLANGAFTGSSITEIWIPDGKKPADISIPNDAPLATEGCDPALKIYIHADDIEDFINEVYFWGNYAGYFAIKP